MRSKPWSKTPSPARSCGGRSTGILDLERLLSRVTLEAANPRDLLALAASLARIPAARAALAELAAPRLQWLHAAS